MKAVETKKKNSRSFWMYAEVVLAALSLFIAFNLIASEGSETTPVYYFILMITLAIQSFCAAFSARGKKHHRAQAIVFLAGGVGYLASAILYLCMGVVLFTLKFTAAVFFAIVIANRVLAILRRPLVRYILLNALVILVILALLVFLIFPWDFESPALIILLMFIIAIKSLVTIIRVSFSKIHFGVLRKIVRKTYVSEILFGLMILIAAFSFVLMHTEPGIKDYLDALWYCFAIVTTIGFGDIAATSLLGRVLSVILGLYGIVVVAVITSVVVNFYNEVKHEREEGAEEHADGKAAKKPTPEETTPAGTAPAETMSAEPAPTESSPEKPAL